MSRLSFQLLHPRHWLVWVGVFLATIICWIPYRLRDSMVALIAQLCYRKDSRQMRNARANLNLCYPHWSVQKTEAFLRQNFIRYFQILAQSPFIWWGNRRVLEKKLEMRQIENLKAVRNVDQPIILLFVHSMAIDMVAVGLSIHYSMCGIYKPFKNDVIEWLFRRGRFRYGARMSVRGHDLRNILKEIKSGAMLAYLCDEDYGPESSVFAPFYDHPKATLTVLPRLVRASQAQVVPVASHYEIETGKVIATFLPALQDYPGEDEIKNASVLNHTHQKIIEFCPEQYLWKLRYFRTRSDSSESIYI